MAKEDSFVSGLMESDVFGIARRVSNSLLFPRSPGDHAGSKGETVATNGTAGVRAVGVIRVRVTNEV